MTTHKPYMNGSIPNMHPNGSIPNMHQNGRPPQMFTNGSPPQMYSPQVAPSFYSIPPSANGSSFTFGKRYERVDWKKIAGADVDSITRNLDFHTLQDNIMNVTFCNIDSELDVRMVDPNFVKLFRLAQLTIEYLLHSQDYLSGMVASLEEKIHKVMQDYEETKKSLEKNKADMDEVKKESHKRKKMLVAQQHIMNNGTPGNYNKCAYCTKAFVNHTFLQAHLLRRHSEVMSQMAASGHPGNNPVHVVMSTSQMTTASQMAQSQGNVNNNADVQQEVNQAQQVALERELAEIRERLRITESQLVEERNVRNEITHREKNTILERQKEQDRKIESFKKKIVADQQRELQRQAEMFQSQLKELEEKNRAAENALENITKRRIRPSGLGEMRDDVEDEITELRKQREQFAIKQEEVKSEVESLAADRDARLRTQEEKWKAKMKEIQLQHRQEMAQMNNEIEKKTVATENEREERVRLEAQYKQVLKKSRSQEQLLQEKNASIHQIRQSESESAVAAGRIQEPQREEKQRMADTGTTVSSFTHLSDEEEEDEEEEEEEDEEKTDDQTDYGTLSFGTNTIPYGTLSMTGTLQEKSAGLLQQLKKDPNLLNAMKEELKDMLDASLVRRGIPQGATGINDKVMLDQIGRMKTERLATGRKFTNFFDIRQQILSELEHKAKEKVKDYKPQLKPAIPPHSPAKNTPHVNKGGSSSLPSSPAARRQADSQNKSSTMPKEHRRQLSDGKPQKQTHLKEQPPLQRSISPPRPAPRGSGGKLGGTLNSTMSSTGRSNGREGAMSPGMESTGGYSTTQLSGSKTYGTGTYTGTGTFTETGTYGTGTYTSGSYTYGTGSSSQWADSDLEDDDKPVDTAAKKNPPGVSSGKAIQDEDEDEDDDISEWDDTSELKEISHNKGSRPEKERYVTATPPKSGGMVSELTKSIEMQLQNRGKKPAGGVSTLEMDERKTRSNSKRSDSWDDDDDDFSISSLDEDSPLNSKASGSKRGGANGVRGSTQDTDMSTNTMPTSMWGSSKGGSTYGNANQTGASAARSSIVSVTDFDDSDDDLNLEDLQ